MAHRSCCDCGHSAPKRTRARTALSQPSTRVSSPLCVANGYQTVALFSSSWGRRCIELGHRKRRIHAQVRGCRVRAQADAVPDLALKVLGVAEQRGVAVAGDDQPGVGLAKAAEVVEIAVEAEQELAVAVARSLGRGGDDGDAARRPAGRQRARGARHRSKRSWVQLRGWDQPSVQFGQPLGRAHVGPGAGVQLGADLAGSMAARSSGARGAAVPCGLPGRIGHHGASNSARR